MLEKLGLSEGQVQIIIYIIYLLSALAAGLMAGKLQREKKFMWGALAGTVWFVVDEKHPEERLLPVYANARFAWGDRRVTPYFSGSYGWDCNSRRPYSALEFGTRFRNSKNWDNSLWLGFKSEFRGVGELCGFSLKCGWSF